MQKLRSAALTVWHYLLRHCSFSIILFSFITDIVAAVLLYFLLPVLTNYPPEYIEFMDRFLIPYWKQFAYLLLVLVPLTSFVYWLLVREIDKWQEKLNGKHAFDTEDLRRIRTKCLNLPYILYFLQVFIPFFLFLAYCILFSYLYHNSLGDDLNQIISMFTIFTLSAVILFRFSRLIFKAILLRTGIYTGSEGKRVNLVSKIMLQIIPVFIVALLFTSILGYSLLLKERGNFLFELYHDELHEAFNGFRLDDSSISDETIIQEITWKLEKINYKNTVANQFILKPDGTYITSDSSNNGPFFSTYLKYYAIHDGRVYDKSDAYNGAVIALEGSKGRWLAGVRYSLSQKDVIYYMELNFILLTLFCILMFYLFSKSYSSDVSIIANQLTGIAEGFEAGLAKRVPVTSNDEIGDLVVAFNKIRDCELEYDKLKNEFIANISHEFRTPVNIILNALQLVGSYTGRELTSHDRSRVKAHIGTMKQNCFRLIKLINNLIDCTKLEANFMKINLKNIDILQHIREITGSVGEYIKGRGIALEFETNAGSIVTAVDPDAVERIMLNLLSNAVKFNKPGGRITVGVFYKPDSRIDIVVNDTGIGIPEDKLSHIFRRFEQVENTLTRSHEGSGIGLTIVKSLVELHSGTITASSMLGEGTQFVISLPVSVLQSEVETNVELTGSKVDQGLEKIHIEFSDI